MSLYRNIQAKRKRIKAGSGEEKKDAPTAKNFKMTVRKSLQLFGYGSKITYNKKKTSKKLGFSARAQNDSKAKKKR